MSLLKNPNEIDDAVILNGIIYGQPGTGKTTLALSAPDPVDIDADLGMKRVEKRFQVTSLPLDNYDDALALLESGELAPFKTIVIDTLGKFIERMADSLIAKNPKNRRTDSAQPSMQGWGAIKGEFQTFLRKAKLQGKHLIFVAHEKEEKDGDVRIVRPDVMGSSGKDLVKELDFMGYVQMRGDQRTISFTPDERYYAKNSLQLPPVIVIPDTAKFPNDFITKVVIGRAIERQKEAGVENDKYVALLAVTDSHIKAVNSPETALAALAAIDKAEVMWDSQRVAKRRLLVATQTLGLVYDKEKKTFVAAPKADKAEPTKEAVKEAQPAAQEAKPAETKKAAKKKAPPADEALPGDAEAA